MKKVSVETTQSVPTEAATTPTTLNTSTTMLTTPTTTSLTTTTTTLSPTTPATSTPATTMTTLPPTTTITTSTSMGETIIDIIDNLINMCTTYSQNDIAIVTTNGVHLYDDAASLTTGACRNMTNAELFQGFASLPDKSTWKALLTYTNTFYDLITDADQVYRWQKNDGSIVPVAGYPKTKQDYIAAAVYYTPTHIFNGTQWAVYTQLTGAMTWYFFDASTIYYYRNQPPHEGSLPISDTTNVDNNGTPLNLWYNLPSNVVGVTGQEYTYNFIVVDVKLNVYSYHLPDPYNVSTSSPICVLQGQLRL